MRTRSIIFSFFGFCNVAYYSTVFITLGDMHGVLFLSENIVYTILGIPLLSAGLSWGCVHLMKRRLGQVAWVGILLISLFSSIAGIAFVHILTSILLI